MNQSKIYQLDMFLTEEQSEIAFLRERLEHVRESNDKVRKKLFAENGKMTKKLIDLEERFMIIERNICRGVAK